MAVTINLTKDNKSRYDDDTSISFGDDEGIYWFLQPFFKKIEIETSEAIDLYDDCVFKGENLNKLKVCLEQEIKRINGIDKDSWKVHYGTQVHPSKVELYSHVNKNELLLKLEKWLMMTSAAIDTGEFLWGHGD